MTYGLYAPGLEVIANSFTSRLQAFDPGLVYVFNKRCYVFPDGTASGRFEIYDKNAPGGPKWQLVMRVPLNEDGSLRPADQRDLEAIMQARGRRVDGLLDQMEANAQARDVAVFKHVSNLAASFADDMKYAFRRITSSVESRNRTREAMRDKIREASL